MTKFAMTRWKIVPEYCPWSTYFRKCATVRGARSAFNSIVKLPNEVTTRICGEAAGVVDDVDAGLVCVLAAAGAVAAPSAGLPAGLTAGLGAGVGAEAAVAAV